MGTRRKSKAARLDEAAAVSAMLGRWYEDGAKSYSELTVRNRENAMSLYAQFLEEVKGITNTSLTWECFSAEFIKEWMDWLEGTRGVKPQSINVYLSTVRGFLEYAAGEDVTLVPAYDKAKKIRKRKAPTPAVEGLSEEAEAAVLEEARNSPRNADRNYLMCLFMIRTGARIGEMLGLRLRDLHLDAKDPNVTVFGKGSKYRILNIPEELRTLLKEHISNVHGERRDGDLYLFPTNWHHLDCPLTPRAVEKMVAEIGKRARVKCQEVPENLHPHHFRHTLGCRLAAKNKPLPVIQSILGHTSPDTTMVYITITDRMKLSAQEALETDAQRREQPKFRQDQALKDLFKRMKK